ncbi:MAG: AAA family ATPase [Muribaculaceae bacterium]|nr:AAA family ATPase [Muribaculaceae bacterium]
MRYPIGIQTFHKIIEVGYTYVDKTKCIKSGFSKMRVPFGI